MSLWRHGDGRPGCWKRGRIACGEPRQGRAGFHENRGHGGQPGRDALSRLRVGQAVTQVLKEEKGNLFSYLFSYYGG